LRHVAVSTDSERTLADYERMAEVYADDAETDPMKAAYDRPTILSMAGDVGGRRVLDVGCATGALSRAFAAQGASVLGIDVNPALVKRARETTRADVEFVVADIAEPMPFLGTATFDLVAASLVMHYLEDWGPPLREFARVLRPEGLLVLSTHHPAMDIQLGSPATTYFETILVTDTWHKRGHAFEVRFWHRPMQAIVDALADAGFLIERIPEPVPPREAFDAMPEIWGRLARGPWYLFIRAVRP
jgi:SAM-dependent methyltransferase